MNEFVFTAAGQQLVSRMIAGEATAAFTKVETSDHEYTKSEVEMLTALADVKQEVLISKVTRLDPAKVELLIALDNRELRETYSVKAIGVYARDSDQQEILFGVSVNTDAPDPMPALAGKTISELTYHLVIAVAVSDQIDISVLPSAGATVEQLEELEGNVNEKVEQLLEKTRLLQDELEDVQNELLSVVKQTAIVNNNTTTEAGFALDARQANPTIEGTMANQILQLNNDSMRLLVKRYNADSNSTELAIKNFILSNCPDNGMSFCEVYDDSINFFGEAGNWAIIMLSFDAISKVAICINHWTGMVKKISIGNRDNWTFY